MWKKRGLLLFLIVQFVANSVVTSSGVISYDQRPSGSGTVGRLVKKQERTPVVSTEFGAVSALDIGDGTRRHNYHLQFITLEPNSLFLPVFLHSDMVFYVHTGSGRLSWADTEEEELRKVDLERGDVYRLRSGSLFYLHSSLESERPRLRVIAIFASGDDELEMQEPSVGPYSSVNDLIQGFDKKVLQAAFQVPDEVIEELTSETDTPAIVHAEMQEKKKKKKFWEKDALFIEALLGIKRYNREAAENKKKHSKSKTFNFFKADPDFQNCNGWSTVATKHNLDALHGSHIGVYMVNLTKGSMMGPHWNPKATEVSVVLEGEGMVRVVCPSILAAKECKNSRFRVEEGDVFTVPRFHPMAQISFNNGSLVFMGFSTTAKRNHPQFLAGKASVLQTLDRLVLGASFNVSNTTIDQLLASQKESVVLECTSCAEEEEVLMEKEIEEERQEEEERRREEEERRRQEEQERRRREEEEERRRHEEEEQRRKEEERRREEEEKRRREEESRRQEEEERRRRQEEEEEQRRQEEEERKRQEEEQRKREEEEERRQEEEEQRRQEEERRQHEEEEERQREEEKQRRREEEEQQRRQEAEEARQREEEQRREEEQQQRRQQEEEQRQREEEEEEARQREKEWRRQEERRREEEEEEARQREEEWRHQEERRREAEEEWRRRREERGRGEEETEEEAARREEQERVERERRQEEAARRREHERQPHEWDLVKMASDREQSTDTGKGERRSLLRA